MHIFEFTTETTVMRGGFLPVIIAVLAPIMLITLIILVTGLSLVSWQPPAIWTSQFGTPNSDNSVTAISSSQSAVYAAGYVGSDLFVKAYDQNGHQLWTQHFGHGDDVRGLATNTDAVYLTAFVNGSSQLRKYDTSGNLVWTRINEGGFAFDYFVAVGDARVYVAGTSYTLGKYSSIFIRQYDSLGNLVWTNVLNNSTQSDDVVGGISVSPDGVYLAGEGTLPGYGNSTTPIVFVQKYDFNGTVQWTRELNGIPNALSSDSSGVYVLGSLIRSSPTSPSDAFVRKYDLKGNLLWTFQISPPDYNGFAGTGLSVNRSEVYLTATTGTGNAFLWKYDSSGNNVWFFQKGAPHSTGPQDYMPVSSVDGAVFVGGSLRVGEGPNTAGSEAFVTRYDQSSSLILFGLNPPFSFLLVGSIGGIVAFSVIWSKKYRKRKMHPPNADPMRYGSVKPPR